MTSQLGNRSRKISQPVERVIEQINPTLRVNYFAVGHSGERFSFVRGWVERKIRGHLMRAGERAGLGWKRWSRLWLQEKLNDITIMLSVAGGSWQRNALFVTFLSQGSSNRYEPEVRKNEGDKTSA